MDCNPKFLIEASQDGRFIVDPMVFNDMQMKILNYDKEYGRISHDLEVKEGIIKELKQENERLYNIIYNVTNSN